MLLSRGFGFIIRTTVLFIKLRQTNDPAIKKKLNPLSEAQVRYEPEAFRPKIHSKPYPNGLILLGTARLFFSKFFPGEYCFLLPEFLRFLLLNRA